MPVATIEQIIPSIAAWDRDDEKALKLTDLELSAFGGTAVDFAQYLMNCKGKAPCALHAWGSQLYPCPCVCRDYGLSARRLDEKGLFGLLLQSAVDCEGISFLRHVHPCEALALNGVDPTIDFGTNPRLILSAIGQLASPLQTLWVMIALRSHFDEVRFGKTLFSADTQLRAYMSWLTMRCNLMWPQPAEPQIDD
jgi:hypothetical protein